MKRKTGGIRLPHLKSTENSPTQIMPLSKKLTVLMQQSMGVPCSPLVKKGDEVTVGMKIGESDKFMSVPVHSPASGKVADIIDYRTSSGGTCKAVVIETDGLQTVCPDIKPPAITDRKSFIAAVRESGCCGLGGAGFPTHVKLAFDPEKTPIDTLIINGAECEPYITSDYREFMENGSGIIGGIRLIMKMLEIKSCVIGIEENKPDAISEMNRLLEGSEDISVAALPSSYPQGAEKVLIYSAAGRTVMEGELPSSCGVLVMNVSTAAFIMNYVKTGMPLISKRITVDGSAVDENKRGNYITPVGTPAADVLNFCGCENISEILYGGPMMGVSVADENQPVIKMNNAVLAFSDTAHINTSSCIRCGRCIRACPVKLMPVSLESAYDRGDAAELSRLKINLCINCGCCTYVCPAGRHLAEKNQLAKALARTAKQERK